VPATAFLAMGELAGGIGHAQRRARAQFADQFGEFANPASERRFQDLIASAGQDRSAQDPGAQDRGAQDCAGRDRAGQNGARQDRGAGR
jgi:hypothetical protein